MREGHNALQVSNFRLFVVREKMVLSLKFHQLFSLAGNLKGFIYTCTLLSVSNSSLIMLMSIADKDTRERYLAIETKLVLVNADTRRSTIVPKSFSDYMNQYIDHNQNSRITGKQDILVPPQKAFKTILHTRYSDLDFNYHVNVAEYFRLCSECGTEASLSGYFRHYTSDIAKYPLLDIDATFLGECGPREKLTAVMWQDDNHAQRIYFVVYLKDKAIFQASCLYDYDVLPLPVMSRL